MAQLEKVENGKAIFEIEVESEKFDAATEQAYKKNVKRFNIPGFRRGKAPRKMIEQQYGTGVFFEDAINNILPEAYDKAIEELELDPIDRPEVEVVNAAIGEPLKVKITVAVKPEVVLGKYKGIEIKKVEYNVTDQDVEDNLKALAERNARVVPVDDEKAKVKKGDIANFDFEGFRDGEPFEGGKAEGFDLEIGSGQFIPGFEEQLIGKKKGEDFEINVTFPDDYHASDLAGKDVVFKIKLNAIKRKELPEMDDEFAKDVSEFETLDEFKADILAKLKEAAEDRTKTDTENAVIDKILEDTQIEVPEVMIDEQISHMAGDMDRNLRSQGLNLERYFEMTGMTVEDFKEQNQEKAVAQVKATLLVEAVAKAEKIAPTDEEIEEEYKKMAEKYSIEIENIKKSVTEKTVKKDLSLLKTVEFLVENAKQV